MAKKYYAIKKGRKTGIFGTWDECKLHVKGYPSAEYKSFIHIEEAREFLESKNLERIEIEDAKEINEDENLIKAYVDGSYNSEMHKYSCGVVILYKDKKWTLSEMGDDDDLTSMRNVAGELLGAIRAMEWAVQSDIENPTLVIYHDYEGIHKWAAGSWKANKQGTQDYIKTYQKHAKLIKIEFVKVKAHTGDLYNEEADQLAKDALKYKESIEKDSQFEPEEINKKYKEILKTAIDRYKIKDDSSCMIVPIRDYELTEKIIKEFAKLIWKKEGFLLKEFEGASLRILSKEEIIIGSIRGKNGENLEIELKLKTDESN